ncbi:MAG: EAL domain-containing protein [Eubacterium sp.]|nr:EAL domain-containing protein [Eubacterium sp.]
MGQKLYFDNYTAAGDILVIAICFVIGILVATSYNTRTKTFKLFLNMIIYLGLAALSDMILHDYYAHMAGGSYTPIYVIRVIYHAMLFSLFLVYVVYLVVILNLDRRDVVPIMSVATGVYAIIILTDIILTVSGKGFRIGDDGTASYGPNVFMAGYIAFVSLIVFVILKYRDKLYRKSVLGLFGTMAVSFFILYNQGRHGQAAFTVATFLFPVLAIMYLLHSNPYNVETGTISASALKDAVRYHYEKKLEFYFMSMYLPDFHAEAKELPEEIKAEIRRFPSAHFRKSVLFEISNGHLLLMVPKKGNPRCEESIRKILEAFEVDYEKYRFDYKIVMGKSIDDISRRNEYLSLIRNIMRHMPVNTLHEITDEDVKAFDRSEDILVQLEDIYRKEDLNDERVLVYCQPVLNIKTGKYDTAEALMRLKLPELGMIFPDQFIPLAEDMGFIHVLTKIILHKTCDAVKDLLAEGYEVKRISVNATMSDLRDEAFAKELSDIIEESYIPNSKIAIEVTESQSDRDFNDLKEMIDKLKGIGIKFYLDDFGTGYSNMERIMNLPFDIIKFDRSLVIASQSDKRSEEIVGKLAGMFAELHYSVLYEGVEDEEDEKRCINMHASYLQGYKYSKPIPIEDLKNFFSKSAVSQ